MKKYNVVDLFCGMGGGHIGIERVKDFNTVFALDNWKVATDTFKHNFPGVNVINMDIHNLDENKIEDLLFNKRIDVVIGSPPCQGFSYVSRNKFYSNENSKIEMNKKNHLFLEFLRVCDILSPKFIIMENVKGILTMKDLNGNKVIDNIIKAFNDIGYYVKYDIIPIHDLGLPQVRNRVIFIASFNRKSWINFKFPYEMIEDSIENTIENAISDLENEDGNGVILTENIMNYTKDYDNISDYVKTLRDENINTYQDFYHIPRNKKLTKNRMAQIKTNTCMKDLDENNIYKTKAKRNDTYFRGEKKDRTTTILNVLKSMMIHYKYDRCYSLREVARLQNIPDSYKFLINKYSQSDNYQLLANAIPPILTEYIFKEIKRILDNDTQ